MDKEQQHRSRRRDAFNALIARKEAGSMLRSFSRHKLDDVPLRVHYPEEWETLRKNILTYGKPREGYIFDCAERWGKMIQGAMERPENKNATDVEFTKIVRSCKDFAFVLNDFTGADVAKAVEMLKDNAAYGDRIAAWHQKELKEPQLVNGQIYIEWGATSRPDSPDTKQRRHAEIQRRVASGAYKRATSEVSVPAQDSVSARVRAVGIKPIAKENSVGWFTRTFVAGMKAAKHAVHSTLTGIGRTARFKSTGPRF